MTRITLDQLTYAIEFHHITSVGARRKLNPKHTPVQALTLATIAATDATSGHLAFIASDVALCAHGDRFSRYEGRRLALGKLLRFNRALAKVAEQLALKYCELTGDVVEV